MIIPLWLELKVTEIDKNKVSNRTLCLQDLYTLNKLINAIYDSIKYNYLIDYSVFFFFSQILF